MDVDLTNPSFKSLALNQVPSTNHTKSEITSATSNTYQAAQQTSLEIELALINVIHRDAHEKVIERDNSFKGFYKDVLLFPHAKVATDNSFTKKVSFDDGFRKYMDNTWKFSLIGKFINRTFSKFSFRNACNIFGK